MKLSVAIGTNKQTTFHSIKITVKREAFHVTILEDGKIQMSNCSCGAYGYCDHFYTAISGKTKLLDEAGITTQKKIIASLTNSYEGRKLLWKSQPIAKQMQSSWLKSQLLYNKRTLIRNIKNWFVFGF